MIVKKRGPFFKGYNEYINKYEHPEMMGMEFGVLSMSKEDVMNFDYPKEVVYNLQIGKVRFEYLGKSLEVERKSCFHEGAYLLHVPQNTKVRITCLKDDTEIAVVSTENNKTFEARFLYPDDCLCANEKRGLGLMNDCSTRTVRTFFDRSNCPETNFFLGEVVNEPGKWSSFPPHSHIEPEFYYYKFLPENGYGLAEYGEDAYKIKHNYMMGMPANITHSQVVTPGYAEYYFWCIRLQDDTNIITNQVKEFEWVMSKDAKYFPEI